MTVGAKMSKLNGQKHRNSQILEFEPGGPPELEKKRRVLRTTYLTVAFAPLRAEMSENAAGETRRCREIVKIMISRNSRKLTFCHL